MKTVCVVTGTRAEYGLLRPVMRAIEKSNALRLQVVVTGMHLLDRDERMVDERTVHEIRGDGFTVDSEVELAAQEDSQVAMGCAVGEGVVRMIDAFQDLCPDVVLLLGDRMEVFAAAIAAMFCRTCIAHVHGGDVGRGGFDESMRHAITKLSHVHFAATEKSQERILRMGERPENVHLVGAPGLDGILDGPFLPREELSEKLARIDLTEKPIVVVQHPLSTDPESAGKEMRETVEAALPFDRPLVIIWPNNDAGWRRIVDVTKGYMGAKVSWSINLPRPTYLSLLNIAAVLVGNSSSGIIEAASFKLPVVNVGERQLGREHTENVIDVPAEREAITAAIDTALNDQTFRAQLEHLSNPYGDGHASERIVKVLEELEINHELIQKQFVD